MHPYGGLRIDGELRVNVPCLKAVFGDFNNDFNFDFNVGRLEQYISGDNTNFDIDLI